MLGLRLYSTGLEPQRSTRAPDVVKARFAQYTNALNALAERTRTPLPSLVFSFAVLHELTAIAPLIVFFFSARTLNIGERVLKAFPFSVEAFQPPPSVPEPPEKEHDFWRTLPRRWWSEGIYRAERVGKRYGLFGYPKKGTEEANIASESGSPQETLLMKTVAPDVLNFTFAYVFTKVLLPVRIGLSMYWSPAFSRRIVEPTREAIMRYIRRKST